MRKFFMFLLVISFLFTSYIPAIAMESDIYRYEEQKQLTPQEENLWRYKMRRITVRQELGKWMIIEGINTELSDIQLLKLVNNEKIAIERLKGIAMKQDIGGSFVIAGILAGLASGLFISDIIKVENGTIYGIVGIIGGLGLLIIGNLISPLIADEADHVINIEEARDAAEKYNSQLRKTLKLSDDID